MRLIALLVILFQFSAVSASQVPRLLKVISFQEDSQFVTQIKFDKSVDGIQSDIEFINQTIQVNFKGVEMPEKKSFLKVANGDVKSVYTFQAADEVLRSRIIYFKPVDVKKYKGNVSVTAKGKTVSIAVKSPKAYTPGEEDLDLPLVKPKSVESASTGSIKQKSDDIITFEMGSKKKNTVSKVSEMKESDQSINLDDRDESEIPVLAPARVKEAKSGSAYGRILTSLGIVFVLGMGVLLFIKWWSKNYRPNKMASKIQVLTQHSLGPKRNLAIIRVAGETILLGVTDHNISMIKELSLMDDELPEFTPDSFSNELDKELVSESPEAVLLAEKDEFSEVGITNAISERLKGMKIL